jgi:predicted nucleic acid-binding protein
VKSDCFLDTNIWVYAFLDSENEPVKRAVALKLLQDLSLAGRIVVSAQVVNEFHWTLSRKYEITDRLIRDKVENGIVLIADIVPLDLTQYRDAFPLRTRYHLSFWDSLIVASALQSGCATIYSEDMGHGQTIEKSLRIVNPFL